MYHGFPDILKMGEIHKHRMMSLLVVMAQQAKTCPRLDSLHYTAMVLESRSKYCKAEVAEVVGGGLKDHLPESMSVLCKGARSSRDRASLLSKQIIRLCDLTAPSCQLTTSSSLRERISSPSADSFPHDSEMRLLAVEDSTPARNDRPQSSCWR
jgi:hypothetical protein